MNDPISEMFVQIQNAQSVDRESIIIPFSKVKMAILATLKQNKKIVDFNETKDKKISKIEIKLTDDNALIKRVSRPGRRVYASNGQIPRPRSPKGLIIISTSEGIMTGEDARKKGLGGEVIGEII